MVREDLAQQVGVVGVCSSQSGKDAGMEVGEDTVVVAAHHVVVILADLVQDVKGNGDVDGLASLVCELEVATAVVIPPIFV